MTYPHPNDVYILEYSGALRTITNWTDLDFKDWDYAIWAQSSDPYTIRWRLIVDERNTWTNSIIDKPKALPANWTI